MNWNQVDCKNVRSALPNGNECAVFESYVCYIGMWAHNGYGYG